MNSTALSTADSSAYWDALAPHHDLIEDTFFDRVSLRLILKDVHAPVLVVGAGQGLIVEALRDLGMACDGVDLNAEMVRYARARRGLELVQADAKALPFEDGAYQTVIYASGVIDMMESDADVEDVLDEARRVIAPGGKIFVAFYQFSAATEEFAMRLGLIRNHTVRFRELLEMHRQSPIETVAWVAKSAGISYPAAVMRMLQLWASSSWQEKRNAFRMRRLFADREYANALIHAAPETQPYRDAAEIRDLFARLGMAIRGWERSPSSQIVRI